MNRSEGIVREQLAIRQKAVERERLRVLEEEAVAIAAAKHKTADYWPEPRDPNTLPASMRPKGWAS